MASKLDVDEIAAKNGTDPVTLTKQSAAKSYAHFNGGNVSGSVSIYESFGKSSITDNGSADYTLTASSAMSSTQYIVTTSGNGGTAGYLGIRNSSATASLTSTTERYYSSYNGGFSEANNYVSTLIDRAAA